MHDKGDWVGDDSAVVRHEVNLSNRDVLVVGFNVDFHNKINSQKDNLFKCPVLYNKYVIDLTV